MMSEKRLSELGMVILETKSSHFFGHSNVRPTFKAMSTLFDFLLKILLSKIEI